MCAATFVALLAVGVGCSTDDLIPSATVTDFYGMYADDAGGKGTIDLQGVAAATTATHLGTTCPGTFLTGHINVAGQPTVDLSGCWENSTGYISFGDNN